MSYTSRLFYEELRSLDTATAATYAAIGTPLEHNASIIKIVNLSNKNLIISVDGVNDHDVVAANGFVLYDITTNSPHVNQVFVDLGRQYYAKTSDAAAGTGLVYLVVQYVYQT